MELMDRFMPLMSRALHYASPTAANPLQASPAPDAADGPAGHVPLTDVCTALCELADAERGIAGTQAATGLLRDPKQQDDLRESRFVVYAWVDELLLNAGRADAPAWMGMSLQSRYFETSTAGREVFIRLAERLRGIGQGGQQDTLSPLLAAVQSPTSEALPGDAVQEGLQLAADLERAAAQPLTAADREVLRVYATCLLYGLCGQFFPYSEVLQRLRTASRTFLAATDTAPKDRGDPPAPLSPLHWLEPALYVVLPVCATVAFAVYCADVLANLPLTAFQL